ncbi:MAG: DUF3365 domain-containing protein [Planctomycetes bacterium]|nr:DUF3365 domain-containing protein [Planctomycetota bacterium]MCB9868642.1 DUF3365 domain-containing protein [Planctomycetota bacterium]
MHRDSVRWRHRALLGAMLLCACAEPPDWTPASTEQVAALQGKQVKAERARDALAAALLKELSSALTKGGPASGIEVCSRRSGEIAAAVRAEHGVAIGRTSFKLRNPSNAAPIWAADAVRDKVAEPRIFRSRSGSLGALYPIRLQPQCTLCHGPADQLAPDVRKALAARYPMDSATGFRPGDLRGWFWVEVP